MSIRDIISQGPPAPREATVEHKGSEYRLVGRPDAATLAPALGLNPGRAATLAKHYSQVAGFEVTAEQVPQILIVAQTLVDEDSGGDGRFDEAVVATLLAVDYPFFLKLLGAAYEVCGFAGEEENGASALEAAALGNSEASPSQD